MFHSESREGVNGRFVKCRLLASPWARQSLGGKYRTSQHIVNRRTTESNYFVNLMCSQNHRAQRAKSTKKENKKTPNLSVLTYISNNNENIKMMLRASFTTTHLNNISAFVDQQVLLRAAERKANKVLPESWTPDNWSVVCGRGKDCYEHVGNRRFRVLVDLNLEKYAAAKSKVAKSAIVMSIFDAIIEGSNNGGFVKQDPTTKRWSIVDDDSAREKIGQQFRIQLSQKQTKDNKENTSSQKNQQQQQQRRREPKSKQAMKKQNENKKDEAITSTRTKDTSNNTQLEPTLFDEIVDILDFEIDCNEEDLLQIMAATA